MQYSRFKSMQRKYFQSFRYHLNWGRNFKQFHFENNNIRLLNVNHSKMPLSSLRNSFRRKNKPQKLKVTEDSLFENSQDKQAQVRSFQYTCLENAEICKCYIRLNRCCLYLLFRLKSQISIIQWLHFELILLVCSFTMS